MKHPIRLLVAAVLAAVCLIANVPPASAQVLPREVRNIASPWPIVLGGVGSNVLGTTIATGNNGIWTPSAAIDVPRTLDGLDLQITWSMPLVTNGVGQTAFVFQGSYDGTNYDRRLIYVIEPAAAASTNTFVTTTNLSNAFISQYKKLRLAAITNGSPATISNFIVTAVFTK